ncbi:MAG: hypothetical protein HY658_09255, partial [Actinobacteria bacterium]|nr:hypothetical protein [Actinomycetota bacterium]
TTRLLDALARGAEFLGDDWLIVDEGGTVYPFVLSFGLTDRLLSEHAGLRRRLPLSSRVGFGLRSGLRAAALAGAGRSASPVARGVRWAAELGAATSWRRGALAAFFPEVEVGRPGPIDRIEMLDGDPGPDPARRLAATVGFELARDLRALEYLLAPEALDVLDRATVAEREVLAAVVASSQVVALPPRPAGGTQAGPPSA